ncbi:MAG: ribonuclease III [Alphaproteobacteria bacterium]
MTRALEKVIGYDFKDHKLLERALTHSSLKSQGSYERLEFLGDRVLGLAVAAKLYRTFPKYNEGDLSRRLSSLVRRETLIKVGKKLELQKYIRMSRSAFHGREQQKDSILADCVESIIAAIYIDDGLQAAEAFIERFWQDMYDNPDAVGKDAKSRLQEWAHEHGMEPPTYTLVKTGGTDHAPKFTIQVEVKSGEKAEAVGGSKKKTEQEAAAKLLESLGISLNDT